MTRDLEHLAIFAIILTALYGAFCILVLGLGL